jgi:hypothetical protein
MSNTIGPFISMAAAPEWCDDSPIGQLRKQYVDENPGVTFVKEHIPGAHQMGLNEKNNFFWVVDSPVEPRKPGVYSRTYKINSKQTNHWINYIHNSSNTMLKEWECNKIAQPTRAMMSIDFGRTLQIEEWFFWEMCQYAKKVQQYNEETARKEQEQREQAKRQYEQNRIQQLEKEKRIRERKIETEAKRRINEMAEQMAFESAVQNKMAELLASTSTLDARMKVREAELRDLFM